MERLSEEEVEEIRRLVMEEFPDDPAMQQVHMARRILSLEARKQGVTVADLVRAAACRT
jgi:hypothetical protein